MSTAETQKATMDAESVSDADVDRYYQAAKALEPEQSGSSISDAITSIRWGVTVNIGNYESVRLDAEADVSMVGTAEFTLQELEMWVAAHAPVSEQSRRERYQRREADEEYLKELTNRLERAKAQWQKTVAFLERLGLQVPEPLVDDLPF